jgi:hypothetical protein
VSRADGQFVERHVSGRGPRIVTTWDDEHDRDARVSSPSLSHPVVPATSGAAAAIRQIGDWRPSTKNVMNFGLERLTPAIDVY